MPVAQGTVNRNGDGEFLHLDSRIEELQRNLIAMMSDDVRVGLLDSIPGIGTWSAVALVLEIGDPVRFTDVRQLVAWAGLDPQTQAALEVEYRKRLKDMSCRFC